MNELRYDLNRSIGHKVAQAYRHLNNRLNQSFKENGYPVTTEQWLLLVYLWRQDGLAQHELANLTQKDQPSISRLVDTMIKRGLVRRSCDPEDRRANQIFLTAEAVALRPELEHIVFGVLTDISEGIAPEDMATTMRVLEQLTLNLK